MLKISQISCFALLMAAGGCSLTSVKDYFTNKSFGGTSNMPAHASEVKNAGSIVVCRSKQCAPAKLSMSKEYIYNSLLHLFDNNNYQKALICDADASTHTCLENYITLPITAGVAPTSAYFDYVKITDVAVGKGNNRLNLILNYNLTFGGQTPDCTPSKSILFAKSVNHVILEDSGYNCKMTAIGATSVKTVFSIDYIDLDYGFIGGYYSIGLSGPAYGGGSGYMMLRLPKDAYPLAPELQAKKSRNKSQSQPAAIPGINIETEVINASGANEEERAVQIFPINKK